MCKAQFMICDHRHIIILIIDTSLDICIARLRKRAQCTTDYVSSIFSLDDCNFGRNSFTLIWQTMKRIYMLDSQQKCSRRHVPCRYRAIPFSDEGLSGDPSTPVARWYSRVPNIHTRPSHHPLNLQTGSLCMYTSSCDCQNFCLTVTPPRLRYCGWKIGKYRL